MKKENKDKLFGNSGENWTNFDYKNDKKTSPGGSRDIYEYDIDIFTFLRNILYWNEDENTVYETTWVVEENEKILWIGKWNILTETLPRKKINAQLAIDVVEYTKAYDRI